MELLNDPLAWGIGGVAFLILVSPYIYKVIALLFRKNKVDCLQKINWLMRIHGDLQDATARKAISDVMMVLIEEHNSHE